MIESLFIICGQIILAVGMIALSMAICIIPLMVIVMLCVMIADVIGTMFAGLFRR